MDFKNDEKYKLVISVYCNDLCHKFIVEHVPFKLSKVLFKFQQLPNSILIGKVTGKGVNRDAGYDLEIWITYTCTRLEKAVMWIRRKISEEMKTTENMKNKCLK